MIRAGGLRPLTCSTACVCVNEMTQARRCPRMRRRSTRHSSSSARPRCRRRRLAAETTSLRHARPGAILAPRTPIWRSTIPSACEDFHAYRMTRWRGCRPCGGAPRELSRGGAAGRHCRRLTGHRRYPRGAHAADARRRLAIAPLRAAAAVRGDRLRCAAAAARRGGVLKTAGARLHRSPFVCAATAAGLFPEPPPLNSWCWHRRRHNSLPFILPVPVFVPSRSISARPPLRRRRTDHLQQHPQYGDHQQYHQREFTIQPEGLK